MGVRSSVIAYRGQKILFVINDAPYGNERPYNAFRHAMNLLGDWILEADKMIVY